jgi:hypothetical protein
MTLLYSLKYMVQVGWAFRQYVHDVVGKACFLLIFRCASFLAAEFASQLHKAAHELAL